MNKLFKLALGIGLCAATVSMASYSDFTQLNDASCRPEASGGPHKLHLTANPANPYHIDGKFVVDSGCTLIIDEGTWIYGSYDKDDANSASMIIVAPGGYIDAQGTADDPIVMTGFGDEKLDPTAVGPGAKGLWAGLVLLGYAPHSDTGYLYPEGVAAGDERLNAGGNDPNDNSGILKYVSIRHGGSAIASNSEVNGLTLYCVGDGTTVEYVEVISNLDDGIEFFGGTVNVKYACVSFCADDHFDFDHGWSGMGQFWFSLGQDYEGDHQGEWDGMKGGDANDPSDPIISNFTLIGSGSVCANKKRAIQLADSCGGEFYNGIITQTSGPEVIKRRVHDFAMPKEFGAGLEMKKVIFWDFDSSKGNNWEYICNPSSDSTYLKSHNAITNPKLLGIGREVRKYGLDPRLARTSPAIDYYQSMSDSWFDDNYYAGAFDTTDLWIDKWTALSRYGILVNETHNQALYITPSTGTRYPKNYTLPLLFILENTTAFPQTGKDHFNFTCDGVDITDAFLDLATNIDPSGERQGWQIMLSPASGIVPNDGGTKPKDEVGTHVFNTTWPLNNGTVEKATTTILLFD